MLEWLFTPAAGGGGLIEALTICWVGPECLALQN